MPPEQVIKSSSPELHADSWVVVRSYAHESPTATNASRSFAKNPQLFTNVYSSQLGQVTQAVVGKATYTFNTAATVVVPRSGRALADQVYTGTGRPCMRAAPLRWKCHCYLSLPGCIVPVPRRSKRHMHALCSDSVPCTASH